MVRCRDAATGSNATNTTTSLSVAIFLLCTLPGLRLSQREFALWPSKGEVHVRKVLHLPIASFNGGRYVIRPFEREVTGKADGRARVKASIHTILSTFDDEEWSIITLMVEHLDSQLKYTDLFAPSCGSIGDFTDMKKYEEGYVIPSRMQNFNFPVRKFDGAFYEQVHPFDPFFFCAKVHPTGALLFTPHHSQLTLLQHLCIQFQFAKKIAGDPIRPYAGFKLMVYLQYLEI